MKNQMLRIVALLGLTAATLAAQAKALPKFMNAQQLTAWRAQHTAPAVAAAQAPDEQTSFFTGKPYDAANDTYSFKYRAYSPSLARWTSADPSGFPDGANNMAYAPVPTRSLDQLGLYTAWYTETEDMRILLAQSQAWHAVGWYFAANVLAHFYNALGPSDYVGLEADAGEIKQSKEFRSTALKTLKSLYSSYGLGSCDVGTLYNGNWNPAFNVRYTSGDLLYALGGAHFWYNGTLTVTGGTSGFTYTFSGTMQQVDLYTFDTWDSWLAAWAGDKSDRAARDLQFQYNRKAFYNKESWTDAFTWE